MAQTGFDPEIMARTYLEGRRWPSGPICPKCDSGARISNRPGEYYRCGACALDFTVRVGTVLMRSHLPLTQWLYTMSLVRLGKIGSQTLAGVLDVTPRTAWMVLKRLRLACGLGPREQFVDLTPDLDAFVDRVLSYRPRFWKLRIQPR